MSELREELRAKINDAYYDARNAGRSMDQASHDAADAVLRVLAEHVDTQQVREQLAQVLNTWAPDDLVNGLMSVISPLLTYYRAVTERAEADLAAARQQLDQVRNDYNHLHDLYGQIYNQLVRALATSRRGLTGHDLLAILDAPARPAGHDETGQ
jgi:Spy/CpxP family protein refolding chaperone